jgi:hypothetical protein
MTDGRRAYDERGFLQKKKKKAKEERSTPQNQGVNRTDLTVEAILV